MKTPAALQEVLAEGTGISGMFLTPKYFFLKHPKKKPSVIRQVFDEKTQEWIDLDPSTLKTADYRMISVYLYTQYNVRINDIAVFMKLSVQATNGHASGAGNISHSKESK